MIVAEKPPLSEVYLAHYGVKGMKWGVRKSRSSTDDRGKKPDLPAGKKSPNPEPNKYFGMTAKQATVGATVLVGMAVAAVLFDKYGGPSAARLEEGFRSSTLKIGKDHAERIMGVDARSTQPTTFPLGQTFNRISRQAETELRNGAYATYTKKDNLSYTAHWGGDKTHAIKIQARGDIKAPTLQERFSTMAELVDKRLPDLDNRTVRQALADRQPTRAAKNWVKKASSEELGKYHYSSMTGDRWEANPIGRAYLGALRNKGFSAMQDDRDTGSLAESAMVLINKNMFKITSNSKLSKDELDTAYNDYQRLLKS